MQTLVSPIETAGHPYNSAKVLTKFLHIDVLPILNSLLSYAFFQAQYAPNPFSARTLPWIPLGKLTMPSVSQSRHFWHLEQCPDFLP